ncbi:MAG: tRNA (adenosine(37)-N6)-threonylcarbamoyltransferase complex ATPase subunit type 1 TsaE [Candidatus Paceibacterota bacterium]
MEREIKEENLKQIAKEIIDEVSLIKKDEASLVILSGELGAGKTALSKEIAKYLGVKEKIISPTFVIMKIYKTKDKNFKKLIHIDSYRLNKSSELLILGWEEIMKDKNNLILVEWPENVPECTASPLCSIEIIHINEDTRNLKIKFCP